MCQQPPHGQRACSLIHTHVHTHTVWSESKEIDVTRQEHTLKGQNNDLLRFGNL